MSSPRILPYALSATFFAVILAVWINHYKPFVSMKDFVFVMGSILSAAILIIHIILSGKIPVRRERIYLAVSAFFAYIVLMHLIMPYTSAYYVFMMLWFVLLFWIIGYGIDDKGRVIIIYGICIASIIASLYSFAQFFGVDYAGFVNYFGSRFEFGTRTFGPFGNPNLLGGFSVAILPVVLAFLIRSFSQQRWKQWFFGIVFVLNGIALIMSQTRSSWIAAIIAIALFIGILIVRRSSIKVHTAALIAIGVIIFTSILGIGYIMKTNDALLNPLTVNIRSFYYTNTLSMIADRPLFGHGPGTFAVYYPVTRDKRVAYQLGEKEMEFRVEHPHNEHLELLSDLGIIGYVLFVWIIIEALMRLYRRHDIISMGIAVGIIGLLIDGLMTQNLRFTVVAMMLWLLIGFAAARVSNPTAGTKKSSATYKVTPFRVMASIVVLMILFVPAHAAYTSMQADYYVKQGISYYVAGSYATAIRMFDQALARDAVNERSLYYGAASYRYLNLNNSAIKLYERLVAKNPNFIQANYNLGMMYLRNGEYEKALPYLQRQTHVNEMYWQAFYALAAVHYTLGNYDAAHRALEQIDIIHTISPLTASERSSYYRLRAQMYLEVGDELRATEILRQLNEFAPSEDIARFLADEFNELNISVDD